MNKAPPPIRDVAPVETGKRQDILNGARSVFRAEGFDGASMDKIAQTARVSKGTLYVYFRNKEELFQELVLLDRADAAEQIFVIEDDDADVGEVLFRLGERFLTLMTRPQHVSLLRLVMGAAEKYPEPARLFFEMGPCFGIATLSAYLDRQVARGRLRIDDDTSLAAAHFLNLCHGKIVKALLFKHAEPPAPAEIAATVDSAVRLFLRAYGADRP